MIIFGTRTIHTTRERGEFHCPACGAKQAFRKRRARSFFHVYFIPLIPVSGGQEYIKCNACKGDFQLAVLEHDPGAAAAALDMAFMKAVVDIVVVIAAADGEIETSEVARAGEIVREITKVDMPPDELYARATEALDGHVPVDADLRALAPHINEHGKELLVRIALDMAGADGHIDDSEMEVVARIGENLGMSAAHLRGIIATDADEAATQP